MPTSARHIVTILTVALAGCGLTGCGTINEKIAAGVSDAIPAAIGGMPADAPPRPGTAKYDEYMRERERKRLLPASERGEEAKPAARRRSAIPLALAQSMNTTVLRPLRITRSSR